MSQADTINLFDSNHEKVGWWLTYLDKDLAETKDSSNAVYFKYSYFDGKFDYFKTSKLGTNKNPVIAPTPIKTDLKIKPLHGEYKANFKNGKTRFSLTSQNGRLLEYQEYYKNGNLKHVFKYTESCGDTEFHYCIYLYNNDGSLKLKTTLQTPKK